MPDWTHAIAHLFIELADKDKCAFNQTQVRCFRVALAERRSAILCQVC